MRLGAGSAAEPTVKVHAGQDELHSLVDVDGVQLPLGRQNQHISLTRPLGQHTSYYPRITKSIIRFMFKIKYFLNNCADDYTTLLHGSSQCRGTLRSIAWALHNFRR